MTLTHPHIAQDELRIVSAVVRAALAAGHVISVCDGEEYPLKRSTDHDAIIAAMGSTDEDHLVIRAPHGSRIGTIYFVYGNGEDVVSDYTDTPAIHALVEAGDAA